MVDLGELAERRRVDRRLPEMPHASFKLIFCLASLAILCTSVVGQEETANYWFRKSGEFLDNRSLKEADYALDRALQLDPRNVSIWLSKALVLELLGKGDESLGGYSKALEIVDEDLKVDPQDADALWSKGVALDALQRQAEATAAREKAVEIYNRTLSENPQDSETWFKMAEVLVSLYREDEAVLAYRKSAELNGSKRADAWLAAGHLLEEQGRHNESIEAFDQALQSIPASDAREQAFVWEIKAMSLEDAGRRDEAQQAYERITELQPENAVAWWRLAALLKDQRRYNQSMQAYDKVLELQPQFMEEARAWMGKGDILNETGRRGDAMAAYTRALEIEDRELQENPESYIAWLDKGRILYRMGRYEEASRPTTMRSGSLRSRWACSRHGSARARSTSGLAEMRRPWKPSGRRSSCIRLITMHGTAKERPSRPWASAPRLTWPSRWQRSWGIRGNPCLNF